jgi:hypothetical protein
VPAILVAIPALLVARGERWNLPIYPDAQRRDWARLAQFSEPAHNVDWICQQHILDPHPRSLLDRKCEFGSGTGDARLLLLGDSHAAHFAPFLRVASEARGLRGRSVALGSCAPLTGSLRSVVSASRLEACESGMALIFERASEFPLLAIGAAWAGYARNDPSFWERLESQLRALVDRGHKIWLLPRVPELADYDPACPAKRVRVGRWLKCPTEFARRDAGSDTNERLAAIAGRIAGVTFLPLHDELCRGPVCIATDEEGNFLYADSSHLSVSGSYHLARILERENRLPDLTR